MQTPLHQSISIIVKGNISSYHITIYGQNFDDAKDFNNSAAKIYDKLLRSKEVNDLQILATKHRGEDNLFEKNIICSGIIDVALFRETVKAMPQTHVTLSMPQKIKRRQQVNFSQHLRDLNHNMADLINPKRQKVKKSFSSNSTRQNSP